MLYPSIDAMSYGPVHPLFSLQTSTLLRSGRDRTSCVLGPFRVWMARLISTSARIVLSIFIAFWTARALRTMSGDVGESWSILGYVPKTRSVGTTPFGPAVSFSALTAICKIVSSSVQCPISDWSISYARRSGTWARSILPTAQCAPTGISSHDIPMIWALLRNSSEAKFVPGSCTMRSGGPMYVWIQDLQRAFHVSRRVGNQSIHVNIRLYGLN
jgi:hypothetical protein